MYVCVFDANEAGRAAVCPRLILVLCGAARMRVEVKWGVINLNEVQLFSHLLIIAGLIASGKAGPAICQT